MNELCPKSSLLRFRSLVALASIILGISISLRVAAQETSSVAPDTSASTSSDTTADAATTDNSFSTDTANTSVTPAPSGVTPDTTTTAATTSGTGNPGDNDGLIGVTGIFNGNTTTAGEYDPLTHSARREIDDIIVPGTVGKYPLKMTRYLNTRINDDVGLGPAWQHEYQWHLARADGSKVLSPHGNTWDYRCEMPQGVAEAWESHPTAGNGTFRLADGGRVVFTNYWASSIIDPYGKTTTIERTTVTLTGVPYSLITKITEPGGRYLKFIFGTPDTVGGYQKPLLATVEAHSGPSGNAGDKLIDWVNYTYSLQAAVGSEAAMKVLTGVTYSDGTVAIYNYRGDNVTEGPTSFKTWPLVASCTDVRYKGPMRQITYDYESANSPYTRRHGVISKEKDPTVGYVSKIAPELDPLSNSPTDFTETRGDGPTRTFTYYGDHSYKGAEPEPCPQYTAQPHEQLLLHYTDFQGKTTYLHYDPNTWYISGVTDARGTSGADANYTTYYTRQTNSWGVTRITHPDGTFIKQDFWPPDAQNNGSQTDPWYVWKRTDEGGNTTAYQRDSNNRIIEIDHPDGGVETFSYNNFGQVLTHRMPDNSDVNGNAQARYKHFQYDSRGLLTVEWNSTTNSTPLASDFKTTYTYYNASDPVANYGWIDRVKTKTPPANAQGLIDVEVYEYDRKLDGNGESTGIPCAGRGLVTKITHPNDTHGGTLPSGTYKSFAYDQYGNKKWEENELRQRTRYTYDNYNRLKTVTLPSPGGATTYDYSPTKGSTTLCYLHTTNSPYFVTDPVNIVTANAYDNNWRKRSTTVGAATARFGYDVVGNQIQVTDPRGTALGDATYTTNTAYDARNRKTQITDPQAHATYFYYEDNINLTRIVRADGSAETKHYDRMNRVDSDKVPKEGPPTAPNDFVITNFTYNPSGGISSITITSVKDQTTQTTRFGYDPSDLKTVMLYPNRSDTQVWTYDNVKNLSSRRTVNTATQNFTYDSRNRKIGMTWSNGADSATFDYDVAGRLITANNPNSLITRQYDAAGRLTLDRQNVGTLGTKDVQYGYDWAGKETRLYLTSASYDYTFSYDAMGRFEKILVTPSTLWFQYYYDLASNETQRLRSLNSVAQLYTPDNLNRMAQRDVKTGTSTLSEAYGYDSMSRLKSVVRDDGSNDQFTYYLNGELFTAQYNAAQPTPTPTPTPTPGNQVTTPTFSPAGRNIYPATSVTVTISTTTSGAQIRYTIDRTTPTSTSGILIAASSGTATFTIKAGQTITLQAIAFKSGMTDSTVRSDDYYSENPVSPVPPPGTNAATASPATPRNVTYTIDKSGNRTNVNDTGVNTVYTPNNLNQYINTVGSNPISNGSEHEVSFYQGANYTYVNDERLKSVISATNNYQLAYDALGRCVKRTLNSVITYYVYDGEKPIVEYSAAGAILAKNLYGKGIDEILRRDDYTVTPTRTLYYQQDHEGSITHLTDSAGNVIESYRYDAFGAPTITNTSGIVTHNRFMFTGREYSSTFGIYEYRARAYHPGLGRFTSEDPMGFAAGDYNLFRYCGNDPEDRVDPMGLDSDIWTRTVERMQAYVHGKEMFGGGAIEIGGLNHAIAQLSQAADPSKDTAKVGFTPKVGYVSDPAKLKAVIESYGGSGYAITAVPEQGGIITDAKNNPTTGGIDVTQQVTPITYLPKSEEKAGRSSPLFKEEMKRVNGFEIATLKADSAAQKLARQGFKDTESAKQAVYQSTHGFILQAAREMQLQWDLNHGYYPVSQ